MTADKQTLGAANVGRILGAVGVVLLVSTPLTWLLTGDIGPLLLGKLLLGTLGVVAYLSTNRDFFARMAGSRSSGLMALSLASVAVVLTLVGALNYLVAQHPKEYDLTQEKLYTLTEQTHGLLTRLDSEVHVVAFFASQEPLFAPVKDLLERYSRIGTKLTYEMVDPQSRPDLVKQYHLTQSGPRIVVTARGQDARAKDPSEQELTYAIIKVAEQTSKKVYFLSGHGEGDTADGEHAEGYKGLADAIQAEGYSVEALNFVRPGGAAAAGSQVNTQAGADAGEHLLVPEGVDVLVVLAPRRTLLPPEAAALEAYLERGGRLLVLLEPRQDSGMLGLLAQWRVAVRDDLIVDTNPLGRMMGLGAAAPMIQPVASEHPIVKDLRAAIVMSTVRSLTVAGGGQAGVEAEVLAEAGETAWGETNLGKDGTAARDAQDNLPPLAVAVVASRSNASAGGSSRGGRLVAFGDGDWVSNGYLHMQGNQDLFLNALGWVAEQGDKISIRPKGRNGSQLFLSGEQLGKLKFFSMDLLPVMLVAMGLGIVLIRQQR